MPSSRTRNGAKVKVMEESGQTDAQRRSLRRQLREVQKDIVIDKDDLEDAKSDVFTKVRTQNNELWDQVRYTREAVLDGENLESIATSAARQIDRLVEVPRYDAMRFSTKLKQNLGVAGGGAFDWKKLGSEVGVCFNALPSNICFLAGPLDADYTPKQRKKPERRAKVADSDAEEEEPEDVKRQEKDGDKLSAVEQNICIVERVLKRKCRDAACETNEAEDEEDDDDDDDDATTERKSLSKSRRLNGEIGMVETLFNPKSFTQTVENLFHFSFILKSANAQVYATPDRGPMVQTAPPATDEHPVPRQAILSLNMRDWRRMTEAYQVTKSLVPHRTGSKHARAVSSSQSQEG